MELMGTTIHALYFKWKRSECHMPEKCGRFGICQESKCVACPSPNGLLPWSKKCSSPKLPHCSDGVAVTTDVRYYEIEGVDYFSSAYIYMGGKMY
ncbi:hypothetical protein GIB67_009054 [Kingdonia uniflora]|uniref:Uncharacterized protein n=1 Tax=Kingdonia uniflora TaxID=39325 RepID=A0A7J7P7N5_9MAGN|nr:hypothetical protein GIB67_009054 [Kingdonia uniflora]